SAASPPTLTFSQPLGGATPGPQVVKITTSTPGLSFSVSASVQTPIGGNWLSVSGGSNGATTPGTLTVSVNPSLLGTANYSGSITVLIPQATPSVIVIPVSYNIGPALSIAAGS